MSFCKTLFLFFLFFLNYRFNYKLVNGGMEIEYLKKNSFLQNVTLLKKDLLKKSLCSVMFLFH